MKAAIHTQYGPPDVITLEDINPPSVQADEVLIKVHSSSVNPYDAHFRRGYLPIRLMSGGLTKPKNTRLGVDVAGIVEVIGKDVTRFKVGDQVFGSVRGAYAEYVSANENLVSHKPCNLSFNESAALPCAAVTALQGLRDHAQIKKNDRVLIYGASGGVGHFAVQLAKYYQAQVTAVCSTVNIDWVKELGADVTVDYTQEDFTKNGQHYDIIFDAVGKSTLFNCRRSLSPTGTYVTVNFLNTASHWLQLLTSSLLGKRQGKTFVSKARHSDLELISELAQQGHIKPVIDSSYPLNEIVDAHRHADKGRSKGKVVIELAS